MRSTSAGIVLAAVFAASLPAQSSDSLQFLIPGSSVSALVTDSAGNLYAGGSINNTHGFVARLTVDGTVQFVHTTAGAGPDSITALALGPGGTVFVTGTTNSIDFPTTIEPASKASANEPRAFVEKLDAGGKVQYATLLTGVTSYGRGIAVGSNGEAVVSGQLVDFNFAFHSTPNAVQAGSDVNTGFIVKLDVTGANTLVAIRGFGLGPVALDSAGNIYVAGPNYGAAGITPSAGAFQSTHDLQVCGGTTFVGVACFYQSVAKINPDGTKLLYSTFVTGSFGASPSSLVVDSAGNAVVAGTTNSADYPVTAGAFQTDYRVTSKPLIQSSLPHPAIIPPPITGYITKVNADGTGLIWSTFLSGTGFDSITGLALDSQSRIYVTGLAGSRDLPGAQGVPDGCVPGFYRRLTFVAQLSVKADALLGSRYVCDLDSGSSPQVALRPDGTPIVAAADALRPVDLAAPTPLACTIDPADNAHITHAAPGQLITLFGDDFGTDGVSVSVNSIPAPVLYASRQQINAQIPPEVAGQDLVPVTVTLNGGASLTRVLRLVPRAPSAFLLLQDLNLNDPVFSCNGSSFSPAYPPVARNEDGSLNGCAQPAAPGSVLTFFLNGVGVTTPTVTLATPDSGTVLSIEPESPFGVWRLRIQLPARNVSGTFQPLIDGVPLREPYLGFWVGRQP